MGQNLRGQHICSRGKPNYISIFHNSIANKARCIFIIQFEPHSVLKQIRLVIHFFMNAKFCKLLALFGLKLLQLQIHLL